MSRNAKAIPNFVNKIRLDRPDLPQNTSEPHEEWIDKIGLRVDLMDFRSSGIDITTTPTIDLSKAGLPVDLMDLRHLNGFGITSRTPAIEYHNPLSTALIEK
jgi:hypothetical protein